jgi:hypothetical protein
MLAPSRRRDLYNFWCFFYIKLYILARGSPGLAKVEASPSPPARTVTHRRRPRHGGDHAMRDGRRGRRPRWLVRLVRPRVEGAAPARRPAGEDRAAQVGRRGPALRRLRTHRRNAGGTVPRRRPGSDGGRPRASGRAGPIGRALGDQAEPCGGDGRSGANGRHQGHTPRRPFGRGEPRPLGTDMAEAGATPGRRVAFSRSRSTPRPSGSSAEPARCS